MDGKEVRAGEETSWPESSKTPGRGSSMPCSVTKTARRGSGRGAKRMRRGVGGWRPVGEEARRRL
ncbi:hypothetical protein OF83DRAFT_1115937 [Amylostereum chailletii]|nr:hypothetical protein OF83DRAFT_1115937 [Amylostereum chailletii]